MDIPRSEIDEIKSVPEMAGRRSAIAFAVAKRWLVFGAVTTGIAWLFHSVGLSWPQGVFLGLFLAWLHSCVRDIRWCIERIYYAVGDSEEDLAEINGGFPWARSTLRLRPRK